MSESEVEAGKDYLRRIVSMLTKMSWIDRRNALRWKNDYDYRCADYEYDYEKDEN
jgi:hypothetical protein